MLYQSRQTLQFFPRNISFVFYLVALVAVPSHFHSCGLVLHVERSWRGMNHQYVLWCMGCILQLAGHSTRPGRARVPRSLVCNAIEIRHRYLCMQCQYSEKRASSTSGRTSAGFYRIYVIETTTWKLRQQFSSNPLKSARTPAAQELNTMCQLSQQQILKTGLHAHQSPVISSQ